MYFEFLLRRAHSRNRVDRTYWSGSSLYSFTACSKDVTVGTTGPIGSGFPQFGFPRRFAIVMIPFRSSYPAADFPTLLDGFEGPKDASASLVQAENKTLDW